MITEHGKKNMDRMLLKEFLYQMVLIRQFEQRRLNVGVINNLNKADIILTNHRCHGHYLAFTEDVEGLLSELMGKKTGVVGGLGGSQHISSGNFYSNGIQAGLLPAAAGMGLVEKYHKTGNIVTAFIGDGTLGQGLAYEVFNIVSLWKLPVLIIIENNRYAQSTPIEKHLAGDMVKRVEAFGIEVSELSTFKVDEIFAETKKIIENIRLRRGPFALILNTYRFCSHSKSDDGRNPEEIKCWLRHDPIELLAKQLDEGIVREIEEKVKARISKAEDFARQAEFASLDKLDLDEVMRI
jgi:TPP-dependent pyruvate/acetoin dehydrogenase alpha subunit